MAEVNTAPDALRVTLEVLPHYQGRWIRCAAVKIEVHKDGSATLWLSREEREGAL